jgi:hypothetical protein
VVFSFPSENKSWAYNVFTQQWHRWSSGLSGGRHRSNCYAFFNGKHLVGDFEKGVIYELTDSVRHDDGVEIVSELIFPELWNDGNFLEFNSFQLDMETGAGLEADLTSPASGSDPQVMLKWSDDGLNTWSNEHWLSVGKIGEYNNRAIHRRMGGTTRKRHHMITITDPVLTVLTNAVFNEI